MQIRLFLTSLVRLYALYLLFGALQLVLSIASAIGLVYEGRSFPYQVWAVNLLVNIVFAAVFFRKADAIARFAMPVVENEKEITESPVPLYATILLCFGLFIATWGFLRLTSAASSWLALLWHGGTANELASSELFQIAPAAIVLVAGLVFCARFARTARWIKSKV